MGIASGPRVPLYLFFKKDAVAPANAAMAANKVRRFRPDFTAHPIYRPRNKSQSQSGRTRLPYAALPLNTSTRLAAGTCFFRYMWGI